MATPSRRSIAHLQQAQRAEKCLSLIRIVLRTKREADGDDDIQLKVDPEYSGLLNATNNTRQAASLVIGPICLNAVTRADA